MAALVSNRFQTTLRFNRIALAGVLLIGAGALALAFVLGLEPKSAVMLAGAAGFLLLAVYDLEWAYWAFMFLVCLLPSRFNQQYYSLGSFHFTVYDPLLLMLLDAPW